MRHAHRFALARIVAVATPTSAVQARRLKAFTAECAGTVRDQKRGNHQLADHDALDIGPDRLHNADELVAHAATGVVVRHRLVRPQIAAADRSACDADHGIARLDEAGVGDGLNAHVAGAVYDSCAHSSKLLIPVIPAELELGLQPTCSSADTRSTPIEQLGRGTCMSRQFSGDLAVCGPPHWAVRTHGERADLAARDAARAGDMDVRRLFRVDAHSRG